jgi:hypothetical protein
MHTCNFHIFWVIQTSVRLVILYQSNMQFAAEIFELLYFIQMLFGSVYEWKLVKQTSGVVHFNFAFSTMNLFAIKKGLSITLAQPNPRPSLPDLTLCPCHSMQPW